MMREVGFRRTLSSEAPYLFLSFIIAEWLYKFHSFTLECLAFLVTWFVLSAAGAWAARLLRSAKAVQSQSASS